jgi:acetyltransferase-like isoleucine patch superfamily enzyme
MKKSKLRIIKKITDKLINTFLKLYYLDYTSRMPKYGKNITLSYGIKIDSPEYLYIEDDVHISRLVWFSIAKLQSTPPILRIGKNSWIGSFVQISCINEVIIGKNVMISGRCYIGDTEH